MPRRGEGILVIAGAISLLLLSQIFKHLSYALEKQAESSNSLALRILLILVIVVACLLFCWFRERGFALIRIGRRHFVRTAEEAVRGDSRPPLLVLRSFRDDEQYWVRRTLVSIKSIFLTANQSLEEALVEKLTAHGPVVAVGMPGETLPPLGAARLYVKGDGWQAVVVELIRRAQVIIVILGETSGLQWELEQICQPENLPKVVLVVPPSLHGPEYLWDAFIDKARSTGLNFLPEKIPSQAVLARFPSLNSVEIYRAKKRPTRLIIGINDTVFFVFWPAARFYLKPLQKILDQMHQDKSEAR